MIFIRWALIFGFFLQILSVIYGVLLLKRVKKEQRALIDVLATFSDRSADIAAAISALRKDRE